VGQSLHYAYAMQDSTDRTLRVADASSALPSPRQVIAASTMSLDDM